MTSFQSALDSALQAATQYVAEINEAYEDLLGCSYEEGAYNLEALKKSKTPREAVAVLASIMVDGMGDHVRTKYGDILQSFRVLEAMMRREEGLDP